MPPRKAKTEPHIVEMPPQRMAVVEAHGTPDEAFPTIMPALYGAVYTLKFDLKKKGLNSFKVTGLRGRYPDPLDMPQEEWHYKIALPIPNDTRALTQKVPDVEVKLEDWEYGTVAEIMHIGGYDQEAPTVEKLMQFIKESGYEVAGAHEEEYLTSPDAKVVKTMIRYPISRKD